MGLWLVCMDRRVVCGCVRRREELQVRGKMGMGVDMGCRVECVSQHGEVGIGRWGVLTWGFHVLVPWWIAGIFEWWGASREWDSWEMLVNGG